MTALTSAAADSTPPVGGERVSELVEMLGATDYRTREEAMKALLEGEVGVHRLTQVLDEQYLTPEQRYRLLIVTRTRLVNAPRGAVGISMRWEQRNREEPGEIIITNLLPGLPAIEVLERGDRITHVDERPLRSSGDLLDHVQSRTPGEVVILRIRRPRLDDRGELVLDDDNRVIFDPMEIPLALGSADRLVDSRTGRPQRGGPVENRRRTQAESLDRLYSPQPRQIEIRGDGADELLSAITAPLSVSDTVNAHPAIQALHKRLDVLEELRLKPTASDRVTWQRRLEQLRFLADEQPGLNPAEREYFRAVATRYAALLDQVE
jgi:hypothetical protein